MSDATNKRGVTKKMMDMVADSFKHEPTTEATFSAKLLRAASPKIVTQRWSFKVQCRAKTRTGRQCKRGTVMGRCWQHPCKDGEAPPITWRRYETLLKPRLT